MARSTYGASRRRTRNPVPPRPPRRRAQALVELILVLPFLILLITGMMDVAMIVYAHLELTSAAKEVTKLAGMNKHTSAQLQNIFLQHCRVIGTKTFAVTTSASNANLSNRPSAQIDMALTFPPVGLAAVFRSSNITLTSRAVMPVNTGAGTGLF